MRAIDADALKRRAQKVATEAWKMKLTAKIETTLNQFIDWINDAPTIEPERKTGKWIPCSERLPEEIEKDYWVCTDEDHHNWQCVCKWRKYPSRRGDFWTWHLNARVVAWMPLPEPYKEGEQHE